MVILASKKSKNGIFAVDKSPYLDTIFDNEREYLEFSILLMGNFGYSEHSW